MAEGGGHRAFHSTRNKAPRRVFVPQPPRHFVWASALLEKAQARAGTPHAALAVYPRLLVETTHTFKVLASLVVGCRSTRPRRPGSRLARPSLAPAAHGQAPRHMHSASGPSPPLRAVVRAGLKPALTRRAASQAVRAAVSAIAFRSVRGSRENAHSF